jgi:hypothetical protein
MEKPNPQAEVAPAAQDPVPQADASTSPCAFTFTSGSNNTYLYYCVTQNGNVFYITTPLGRTHNSVYEGYGWCDTSTATAYYDYGYFGDSGNWNVPTLLSANATTLKIARSTSDGLWTLTQTITQVASNSSVRIAMNLKNNRASTIEAHLVRYNYASPDGVLFANYDGTQNSAFTWNSIGSGNHPFGLLMQNVGTAPYPAYNGFAQNTASPPDPCNYTAHWTGGLATNTNGSLVMIYVGILPPRASQTFTMSYKGL